MSLFARVPFILACVILAQAHDHSMEDMDSGSGSSSHSDMMMTPYLHSTPGDALFFKEWVPKSSGAVGGACVALFFLALCERWVAALGSAAARSWAKSAQIQQANALNTASSRPGSNRLPRVLPFIWSIDIPRGILYAAHRALGYALMLAVMTFQVGFIVAIVVGAGVGEMLFGRWHHAGAAQSH